MTKMSVTDTDLLGDLLFGSARTLGGSKHGDDELIVLAADTFTEKPFCIVRHWMVLDVMLPESTEREIKSQGLEPTILYAHLTVFDSEGKHSPGDCILSGYQFDFDGCIFESKDALYILAGRGSRKHASMPAIEALAYAYRLQGH